MVTIADVDESVLLVHDEHREDPSLAFALARLASGPTMPTPMGVLRDVERSVYEIEVQRQLANASERQGSGDLAALLSSGVTWDVA